MLKMSPDWWRGKAPLGEPCAWRAGQAVAEGARRPAGATRDGPGLQNRREAEGHSGGTRRHWYKRHFNCVSHRWSPFFNSRALPYFYLF